MLAQIFRQTTREATMDDTSQFVFAAGRPDTDGGELSGLANDVKSVDDIVASIIAAGQNKLKLPRSAGGRTVPDTVLQFAKTWPSKSQHGSRGTCTAFSFTAMCEYHAAQAEEQPQEPPFSEEFLYSKMRREMKKLAPPNADTGSTYLIQAIRAMQEFGLCTEEILPYQGAQNDPAWSVSDTRKHQEQLSPHILQNRRVFYWRPDLSNLRKPMPFSVGSFSQLITELEVPICISLPIYPDRGILPWTVGIGWDTGVIPEPTQGWEDIPDKKLSGHSICLVGSVSDEEAPGKGWFIFRNSWGPEFAAREPEVDVLKDVLMPGYGAISFDHVQKHCWEVAYLLPSGI